MRITICIGTLAEQEIEGFGAIPHDSQIISDVVFFECSQRQGFIIRVVFDEKYHLMLHQLSPLKGKVKRRSLAFRAFCPYATTMDGNDSLNGCQTHARSEEQP